MDIPERSPVVLNAGGAIRSMEAVGHEEIGSRDETTTRMPTLDEARNSSLAPALQSSSMPGPPSVTSAHFA